MNDYVVEFEDGYELLIQAIDVQEATILAELQSVDIGQDNHGPVVNVRLA
jgi:hypothetical protein